MLFCRGSEAPESGLPPSGEDTPAAQDSTESGDSRSPQETASPADSVLGVGADEERVLDWSQAGEPFGDLFRAVNLDTDKQLEGEEDFARIERLMCLDPADCQPGPLRFWDKVEYGRFSLESPVTHEEVLSELHRRGFPILWTLRGTPAFLNPSCQDCLVEAGGETYHLLRDLTLSAEDPSNPLGVDIAFSAATSTGTTSRRSRRASAAWTG